MYDILVNEYDQEQSGLETKLIYRYKRTSSMHAYFKPKHVPHHVSLLHEMDEDFSISGAFLFNLMFRSRSNQCDRCAHNRLFYLIKQFRAICSIIYGNYYLEIYFKLRRRKFNHALRDFVSSQDRVYLYADNWKHGTSTILWFLSFQLINIWGVFHNNNNYSYALYDNGSSLESTSRLIYINFL